MHTYMYGPNEQYNMACIHIYIYTCIHTHSGMPELARNVAWSKSTVWRVVSDCLTFTISYLTIDYLVRLTIDYLTNNHLTRMTILHKDYLTSKHLTNNNHLTRMTILPNNYLTSKHLTNNHLTTKHLLVIIWLIHLTNNHLTSNQSTNINLPSHSCIRSTQHNILLESKRTKVG